MDEQLLLDVARTRRGLSAARAESPFPSLNHDDIRLPQADDQTAENLSVWLDTVARIVCRILRTSPEEGVP